MTVIENGNWSFNEGNLSTSFGPVGYIEAGSGYPVIFLHGLCLNSFFWRHQVEALSDSRRCIAIDLLAHGRTPAIGLSDYWFEGQASMVLEFADLMGFESFDLVGNDSGGAIAQVLAARASDRISSLTLTNCDVHDNWPPRAMWLVLATARTGLLGATLELFHRWPSINRSIFGYAAKTYENPQFVTDELLRTYLSPLIENKTRKKSITQYCKLSDDQILIKREEGLKSFDSPALIVWGDGDIYFPPKWADWLERTLPNVVGKHIIKNGKLFFPEERHDEFNALLRTIWEGIPQTTNKEEQQ